MEAATIAGLVIGVLPLLVSVFENYETVFQPFVTFRRSSKEVSRFITTLEAQRTIFVNECQLILLAATNREHSIDILRDPNHRLRNDDAIEARLTALLGTSRDTCLQTLKLINEILNKLSSETKDLNILVDKKGAKSSGLSSLRQRLKISFSKTRFEDIVRELQSRNNDLRTLSRQMRELNSHQITPKSAYKIEREHVSAIKMTQEASKRLYEVLARKWICQDSVQHTVCMSLKVKEGSRRQPPSSRICFNVALTCILPERSTWTNPLWLEVESSNAELDSPQNTNNKENIAPLVTAIQDITANKKKVRFDPPNTLPSADTQPSATPLASVQPHLDLGTVESLCRYFHTRLRESPDREACLGVLERAKTFCHFVYPDFETRQEGDDLPSLEQMLQTAASANTKFKWVKKLQLARLLALAILRFWTSPWLDDEWNSGDIYFLGGDKSKQDMDLSAPCVRIRLSDDASMRKIRPASSTQDLSSKLVANPALFRLGIILLELGYDAPIHTLREEQDNDGISANGYVDFFTARRLAVTVSTKFNSRYGKLVRKCLNCDFGVGDELSSSELQGAVMGDVVHELDGCLDAIKKGWVGSEQDFNDAQTL